MKFFSWKTEKIQAYNGRKRYSMKRDYQVSNTIYLRLSISAYFSSARLLSFKATPKTSRRANFTDFGMYFEVPAT